MHRSSHWRRAGLQRRQHRGVPLDRLSSGVARNLRRPIHSIGWPSSRAPPMRCRAACRPVVPRFQAFQSRSHTESWVLARAPACWQFRQKQLCRLFLLFGGAHLVAYADRTILQQPGRGQWRLTSVACCAGAIPACWRHRAGRRRWLNRRHRPAAFKSSRRSFTVPVALPL